MSKPEGTGNAVFWLCLVDVGLRFDVHIIYLRRVGIWGSRKR